LASRWRTDGSAMPTRNDAPDGACSGDSTGRQRTTVPRRRGRAAAYPAPPRPSATPRSPTTRRSTPPHAAGTPAADLSSRTAVPCGRDCRCQPLVAHDSSRILLLVPFDATRYRRATEFVTALPDSLSIHLRAYRDQLPDPRRQPADAHFFR
jgi:hypothetical protein